MFSFKFRMKLVTVPVLLVDRLVINSRQVPSEDLPIRALRGVCGLKEPTLNGAAPSWIGVVAASSNTVLLKLAGLGLLLPTLLNSLTSVPSGASRLADRSGSNG